MAALETAITQIDTLLAAIALDQAKGVLKPAAPTAKGGAAAAGGGAPEQPQQAGKKKEKKGGKVKEKQAAGTGGAAKPAATGAGAATDPFSLADLRVAEVLEVGEVANSEKLLKCRVRVGSEEVRHVVAGLKLHVPMDQLAGSLVVTICNLKPKKLAGEASEAMILAATSPDGRLVQPIVPPVGASVGDQLHLEGLAPSTSLAKVLKTDPWTKVVEGLKVEGGKACFRGTPLCASGVFITVPPNMPDGGGIQ